MLLYGHPLSGNTHKVRLLLGLLGVGHEERSIDIPGGEGRGSAFLGINPLGQVPVLVDGELTLRNAQAILIYLAGRFGEGRWWPAKPAEQALVAHWLSFAANEVQARPQSRAPSFPAGRSRRPAGRPRCGKADVVGPERSPFTLRLA